MSLGAGPAGRLVFPGSPPVEMRPSPGGHGDVFFWGEPGEMILGRAPRHFRSRIPSDSGKFALIVLSIQLSLVPNSDPNRWKPRQKIVTHI